MLKLEGHRFQIRLLEQKNLKLQKRIFMLKLKDETVCKSAKNKAKQTEMTKMNFV